MPLPLVNIVRKNVSLISVLIAASLLTAPPVSAEKASDMNSVRTHGKALTVNEVDNAMYRISPWEAGEPDSFIKMKNGKWKEAESSYAVTKVALGDLNHDGTTDAAAVYYSSGGGTGVFFSVTAFVNKDGRLMAMDNKVLGDRVETRGIRIINGVIIVDVTSHAPNDPASVVSVKRTGRYRLKGNKLIGPDTMY